MIKREPKLHQKPSGYYNAVFYERSRGRKWIALGTTDRRQALGKLHEISKAYLYGEYDPWHDPLRLRTTLADATDAYVKHRDAENFVKSSTRQRQRVLERFAKLLPAGSAVEDISVKKVRAFIHQPGLAEYTRASYYARLNTFFKFCVERGFCDRNPCDDIKRPTEPNKAINYLSPGQLSCLLTAIEHKALNTKRNGEVLWYADVVRFAAGSGLRIGEICALQWKDVDLEAGKVVVRSDEVHRTKNGKERPVQVSPQAAQVLRAWHEQDTPKSGDFVFHGPNTKHLSYALTSRLFRKYRKEAGLPDDLTFHSLRKTYGTILASAGVPIRTIQKLLGHSDIRITAQVYADVMGHAVTEQVNAAFADIEL